MKACIVLQNQYAKLGHAFARILKEKYGVNEFCAYIISEGARQCIRTQTDIHYDPILVDHELHARYADETPDPNYISLFEKTYGPPYVWQYLYTDRKLMMSIGPKEETTAVIDPLYTHENLLRIFQIRAKAIEHMLRTERPDFVLFFSVGTLAHLLLFHIAKKLNIKIYTIDFPRIENRMCISEDYRTLSFVEQTFRDYMKNDAHTPFHTEAKDLIASFRKTGSLHLQYMDIAVGQLPRGAAGIQNILRTVRYLATLSVNYWRNRRRFVYGVTDQNPFRFIGQKLRQRYRIWRGMDDLCRAPDWHEEFAYMPLHFEPELAILLLSPFYFDQIQLARYVARSLPAHMKLYVKEHPAMVSRRSRTYYKELLKIPNIVLIPPTIKSFDLASRAKLVCTITGTGGWEAAMLGRPVITFGEVFYNALSFVKRAHDIEKLPELIRDRLERFSYDEAEMIHFLAATLKESVPFDFSRLWYENDAEKLRTDAGVNRFCDLLMRYIRGV
jgi:hypothetical protein